ncbi:phospholipid scramblase 1-like [Littorina saxatilis]|uniref:Phospholipid scramblase n=1 Tax=Littorina saxatilis TaxID=31220 RepID=A0AAN9BQU9_9CAEN
MSTDGDHVVDRQPQSIAKNEDHGAVRDRNALQTTHDGQVQQPGFQILEKLNKLEVVQRLDTLEVCLGWTRNNRYCIYNEEGEQIFYVYEASVCFNRAVTGALRALALKMSLSTDDQDDVLNLHRPGACSSRCCWACCNLQHMDIGLPSGKVIATMDEVWNFCMPEYRMMDDTGQLLYTVKGGLCHCRCCCQLQFLFVSPDGEEAGRITRSCLGCKELIGAANRFTLEFGDDLSPLQKLTILGGSFLVDLNYFEKQNKCW